MAGLGEAGQLDLCGRVWAAGDRPHYGEVEEMGRTEVSATGLWNKWGGKRENPRRVWFVELEASAAKEPDLGALGSSRLPG